MAKKVKNETVETVEVINEEIQNVNEDKAVSEEVDTIDEITEPAVADEELGTIGEISEPEVDEEAENTDDIIVTYEEEAESDETFFEEEPKANKQDRVLGSNFQFYWNGIEY